MSRQETWALIALPLFVAELCAAVWVVMDFSFLRFALWLLLFGLFAYTFIKSAKAS